MIWAKRPHDDVFGLGLLRQRCAGAKAMHCVIDAARSRCLNDPAYRAIAAAVAIFGGLDHDVSFVFGSALFGCFGPHAQHDVWKGSVTDFVGMGCLYQQPRQHDQAGSSHVLLSSFPLCALKGWPKFRTFSVAPVASQHWQYADAGSPNLFASSPVVKKLASCPLLTQSGHRRCCREGWIFDLRFWHKADMRGRPDLPNPV